MDAHGALLSLDVFDTLLTRAYARPSDVFVEVAQALADAGLLSGPPAIWVARRQAAEAYLWRHASRNVTLEAIYARLAAQSGWSDEQSRQARAIEIDVESASHAPVPLLRPRLESWRRSGGRPLFPTCTCRHGRCAIRSNDMAGSRPARPCLYPAIAMPPRPAGGCSRR